MAANWKITRRWLPHAIRRAWDKSDPGRFSSPSYHDGIGDTVAVHIR